MNLSRRKFLAAAGALTLGAGGCRTLFHGHKRPHVVLCVFDTVRADHTSLHGYRRSTTPRLLDLALHGTLYENAVAPAPWTLPSHAAMFTGQYPFINGAHTYWWPRDESGFFEAYLSDSFLTLAEALSDEGYMTGAFSANTVYMDRFYRLWQGFGEYVVERRPALEVAGEALAWFAANRNKPCFLFLNFMDAHTPYNTAPQPGVVHWEVDPDPELHPRAYEQVMAGNALDPDTRRRLLGQYDAGTANADRGLGVLIDFLRETGEYDNTILVAVSDHGEYLGEFHYLGHSKDVYQGAVWVPMVVRAPGLALPRRVRRPVSLVDVPGIILAGVMGIASRQVYPTLSGTYMPGLPVLSENYYSRRRDLFHETWGHRFQRTRTALYDWPWKLIRSSDGQHELFRLSTDPTEQRNRFDTEPERAEAMLRRLDTVKGPEEGPRPSAGVENRSLTEEERKEMEALGYL